MPRDERLKNLQDAGVDFLETARAKAEDFLREMSRAGDDTQGRAQGALDDLVASGRKGTGQLASVIRKEIQNQLSALGVATQADLAAMEDRLSTSAPTKAAPTKAAPTRPPAARAGATRAPATRATASKTGVSKTGASKTGAAKKTTTGAKKSAKKAAG